jgi:DNA-binding transcriptional MerR regulator
MKYKIGEVADKVGTSVRALRHLDTLGVLKPQFRDSNGYRYYSTADVERLAYINLLQLAGFTLREIPSLLENDNMEEEFDIHARMLKNKGKYLMLLGNLIEETGDSMSLQNASTSLEKFRNSLDAMSKEFHKSDRVENNGNDIHKEIITLLRTFITIDNNSFINYKIIIDIVPMLVNESYFASFMIMMRMYKSGAFKFDELDTIEKNFIKVKNQLESDIV